MTFSISSAALREAVNVVNGAVPTKVTMAILECILLEQDGDRLRLSATDLEVSIVVHLPVLFEETDTEKTSRIAVPAKRLLGTLRELPDVPLTFASSDTFKVTLSTEDGTYSWYGYDGADYPALPELKDSQHITTDAALLSRAMEKTGFAVSKDLTRPAMTGVYFQIDAGEGRIVTSDGHRLVKLVLQSMTCSSPVKFVLPQRALALAGRVAAGGPCELLLGENHICFEYRDMRIVSRLIDETYPNYESVIPYDNNRRFSVNRMSLLAAVKRVGLYSNVASRQIRFDLSANTLTISAHDTEQSGEAQESLVCEYGHDDYMIGFNSNYLSEVLRVIDADHVAFELGPPNRAGILWPVEQQPNEEMMVLVMPVMLNKYA